MLPKTGRLLPSEDEAEVSGVCYVEMISTALHRDLGDTHRAVKTAMRWTGASERTVKNWFAATHGPNGDHLIALIRNSGEVLEAFLKMAGREEALAKIHLHKSRDALVEALNQVEGVIDR